MSAYFGAEAFGKRVRKVGTQEAADEISVIDQRGGFQPRDQIYLGVRRDQRKFGAGEPGETGAAVVERLARRQHTLAERHGAALGDGLEVIAKIEQVSAAAELLEAEREDLIAIVGDHRVGDFVGRLGERLVASVEAERA